MQNTYKESAEITLKDIDSLRKGTRPEKLVRRVLTNLGYSYRLNKYNLPGRPDIVLENLKKIIFVHGCFWHRHACNNSKIPKTNKKYWEKSLQNTQSRDLHNCLTLALLGYDIYIVWECKATIKNYSNLEKDIAEYLGSDRFLSSIKK